MPRVKYDHASKNEKKNGSARVLRSFMLLILAVSVVVFVIHMIDYHELSRERDQLLEQKERYEQKIDELNYRIGSPIDYDDIVRIARERLGLAFPDDTVFYSNGGEQTP